MFGISTDHPPYKSGLNPFCPVYCDQCTAFAWGRALDRLGVTISFNQLPRHACTWSNNIANTDITLVNDYTKPRENSFVIWTNSGNTCNDDYPGHVAYVEKVDGNDVYINEANWESPDYSGFTKRFTTTEIENRGGYEFKTYIYFNHPFSDYYYWDFDNQGTENWNARNALNQGIFTPSWAPEKHFWQIGSTCIL